MTKDERKCPCGRQPATPAEHPLAAAAHKCVDCHDFHQYAMMKGYSQTPSEIVAERAEARFVPVSGLQQ